MSSRHVIYLDGEQTRRVEAAAQYRRISVYDFILTSILDGCFAIEHKRKGEEAKALMPQLPLVCKPGEEGET